jgi:N6-L-threonylcarbamoyladenine synthase
MTPDVVMGIDTSCDETSVGLVSLNGRMLANVVSSQASMYATLGGVVPEMAAREHLARIREVYRAALKQACISKERIAGVTVTRGPGLSGCLAVGMAFAKGMGMGLGVPVVGVDHLEGDIHAAFLAYPDINPPFGYLIASGGHTLLGIF